ncbi:MAG: hypothetical protein U0166_16115 [Acidobacteriota bacterium]
MLDTFRALRRPGALDAILGLVREGIPVADPPQRAELDKLVDEIHRDVGLVLAGTFPEEKLRAVSDRRCAPSRSPELCRVRRIENVAGLASYMVALI